MSGTFRDLKCWQKALDLALSVYHLTGAFPRQEMFGLTSQLRRAVVSVVSNIAEGKGRASERELLHFLANARGSLFEVEAQITLAEKLHYLDRNQANALFARTSETGKLLNGLMRAYDRGQSKPTAA